jgi:RNA polymerase sigma-70 factor, ECF subfamily
MANQGIELFEEHRQFLFGIAYRMLGSAADAEDMVQETFLRWQKIEPGEIKSAEAWLATVVTRLCINHLKSARAQREEYVGVWLPEPIVADYDAANPRENAEQAESLSIAFLVILETLSPTERAVYLLKEVFGYAFDEVAPIVQKSESNCRQPWGSRSMLFRDPDGNLINFFAQTSADIGGGCLANPNESQVLSSPRQST